MDAYLFSFLTSLPNHFTSSLSSSLRASTSPSSASLLVSLLRFDVLKIFDNLSFSKAGRSTGSSDFSVAAKAARPPTIPSAVRKPHMSHDLDVALSQELQQLGSEFLLLVRVGVRPAVQVDSPVEVGLLYLLDG